MKKNNKLNLVALALSLTAIVMAIALLLGSCKEEKKVSLKQPVTNCGDDKCEGNETTLSCEHDCGSMCGDGYCAAASAETSKTCPEDCLMTKVVCGDAYCDTDNIPPETSKTCPQDCGVVCGDGVCNGIETIKSCQKDCWLLSKPTVAICGDGFCDNGADENTASCSKDCGSSCGDGYCHPDDEGTQTCFQDCGSLCGDGICNGDENTGTKTLPRCAADCGKLKKPAPKPTGYKSSPFCGDNHCQPGEYLKCPRDCVNTTPKRPGKLANSGCGPIHKPLKLKKFEWSSDFWTKSSCDD